MKSMKLSGVVFVIVMTTAASAGLYFPRPDLINQQIAACQPDFDHPPRCLPRRFDDAGQDPLAEMVSSRRSPGAGLLPDNLGQAIGASPDAGGQAASTPQQAWMMPPEMSAR